MNFHKYFKERFIKSKKENREQIEIVRRIGKSKNKLEDLEHYAWQVKLLTDNYNMKYCQKDSMEFYINSETIRYRKIYKKRNDKNTSSR